MLRLKQAINVFYVMLSFLFASLSYAGIGVIPQTDEAFEEYLLRVDTFLQQNKQILMVGNKQQEIQAVMPFEYFPAAHCKGETKGLLLSHGLSDSPYGMRSVAQRLSENCVHVRVILLPGHGTRAEDLIDVTREDWRQTFNRSALTFKGEVDSFFVGGFYERGQADLLPFFNFHPWLYLFLVPAIAMRSWSEERKSGTIELLMTLPISTWQAMVAKHLAAWAVLGLSLVLTFPLWLTVNYLGNPDNGIIIAAYLGSWLMAGAFLAIGLCMSALTKNQVIAFILALVVCFLFVVSGSNIVLDAFKSWAPSLVIDLVASFSFALYFLIQAYYGTSNVSSTVLGIGVAFYFVFGGIGAAGGSVVGGITSLFKKTKTYVIDGDFKKWQVFKNLIEKRTK